MEFRLLRYFKAVAEELHFARAAERLHIEQSPLSRAIKDLEYQLGAVLFERSTRQTRLTPAGEALLEDANRIFAAVDQARRNVAAKCNGFLGHLRIGLSDGITQPRLAEVLARSRIEDPEVEIRVIEMSIAQQVICLRCKQLDAGFAMSDDVGDQVLAEPVWRDGLAALLPVGHDLAGKGRLSLGDVATSPLVLCHPERGSGCTRQIELMFLKLGVKPLVADHVTALGTMLTLVGAGFGIGLATLGQLATVQRADVVVRPVSGRDIELTTYLLTAPGERHEALKRFVERAGTWLEKPTKAASTR